MDDRGEQLGVMQTRAAIEIADDRGLDLVEVAPTARPPVCRIMDYGKFKYDNTRKEREARKARKSKAMQEQREVRMKTRIGQHDLAAKTRLVKRLLGSGAKVKVSVMFRGREIAHPDLGMQLLRTVANDLVDEAPPGTTTSVRGTLPGDDTRSQPQSGKRYRINTGEGSCPNLRLTRAREQDSASLRQESSCV